MPDPAARLTAALEGRYRIERELGAGGMATVYLAADLKHDRKVAIKVLKPELAAVLGAERFVQEIKTTAALSHPHILPLFDSGEAGGFLYYVMPYIEGETIRDRLNREGQLGIEEAIRITTEVADALDYAHRHGVIHRDIKPENILLHDGRPMVMDFGIALAVSAAAGGRMTETGLSLGTPHYMSPEQATADKQITARSDVYSLASVMYEMLSGEPPHTGGTAQAIIMKIIAERAQPVTELRQSVPPNVAAALARALEKLPADRFGSAAAFSAALSDPGFTIAGVTGVDVPAATARLDRKRLTYLGIGAGLGIIVTALGFLFMRSAPPPAPVVRFPFTESSSHRLALQGDEDAPFAVSPDGRRIVYSAVDSGKSPQQGLRLYIRSLDQLEGTPLQGTEDGIAPFFSPDGLWVGFATESDEKLKKVPVSGGPAITLAEDVGERFGGGTWGDDGYIVYTDQSEGLSRVPGTGGVPERLLGAGSGERGVLDTLSSGRYYLFWPSALPGGGAVLAERCSPGCGRTDLVVVDAATGSLEVVVPGATRGWYIETGHLLYGTVNGAIYAIPFDPVRRRTSGSPVPVLDQVLTGVASNPRMAISRAGVLLYSRAGLATTGVQVVEVDRSGRETVVIPEPGEFRHPRWSPTRDRIALTTRRQDATQIWIHDVGSGTLSQLTSEGQNLRPTWSPDGSRVAFFSGRGSAADLYWMPADGSGPAERVVDGEDVVNASTTYWTRDGAWIVFDGLADSSRTDEDVFAVGTGTERTRQLVVGTPVDEETGAVSPDGRWMAYGSAEGGDFQVWVRPFLKPGGRWLVSTGPALNPLWSSNNELLYLDTVRDSLVSVRLDFTEGVRVTRRTSLFSWAPYSNGRGSPDYDVSRDGQRILALRDPNAGLETANQTVVVLNWFEEVKRRVSAQGGSQP